MRVVATAGHVDHGKSALLQALTGMEPDRWEQERRRGLTIDLGFVWADLDDEDGQLRPDVAEVDGQPPPALLLPAVGLHAGQPLQQRALAVVDVPGGRHHLHHGFPLVRTMPSRGCGYRAPWRCPDAWWVPRSSTPVRGPTDLWRVRFPSTSATERSEPGAGVVPGSLR